MSVLAIPATAEPATLSPAAGLADGSGFAVEVEDLRATAATFARLRDASAAASASASAQLAGTGGMAGDDAVLARWRQRYDPMVTAWWGAAGAAVTMLGSIATRMTDTGNAYLAAEHAATPNPAGTPERLPRPGSATHPAAAPPSSTGPDEVPDLLADYFPGGHPDRLRAAAAAWTALARSCDGAGRTGDAAFRALLAANSGETFSTMRTFWNGLYVDCATRPLFNAVATGAGVLGTACAELADLIDRARAEVLHAGTEAARAMSPLDLPARLLGRVTWGLTELELLLGTGALAVSYLQAGRDTYERELDELVARLRPADQAELERAAQPAPVTEPPQITLTDVGEVLRVGLRGSAWDGVPGRHPIPDQIHLSRDGAVHILDGIRTRGGHLAGTGAPEKTEFPPGWTRDRILRSALSVARDPTKIRRSAQFGRWIATGVRDGVMMLVVTEPDGQLVTAYPLSGPGVARNPPRGGS